MRIARSDGAHVPLSLRGFELQLELAGDDRVGIVRISTKRGISIE